ncbi:hypothetical protein LEHPIFIF_00217 [Aeromonas phage avDM9-HANS]|nr:hypothetical protein LEHPIFIF_00217 [Aeromonas phage avDM9-HANS]
MKFPTDLLREMTYEDKIAVEIGDWGFTEPFVIESIEKEVYDDRRWSTVYRQILAVISFTQPVRYFETTYSEGATEMQDETPYENDGDFVVLDEVFPVEVVKIEYKRKKNA